jgi:hypothetical protein
MKLAAVPFLTVAFVAYGGAALAAAVFVLVAGGMVYLVADD